MPVRKNGGNAAEEIAASRERRRIGRDLHDHIGQGIAVALRNLELSEICWTEHPDHALARVQSARRVLAETMAAVRTAIDGLRPVEQTGNLQLGLELFLESLAGPELARHIEVNGDQAWAPTETIEEAFLIVRESLRNVITHAEARQVTVHIDITPEELRASVVDNGRGFDPDAGNLGGIGLLSMRERTELLGGSLMLASMPGRGTRIELRIPLSGGA